MLSIPVFPTSEDTPSSKFHGPVLCACTVLNKVRKRLLEVKLGKGTLNFKSQGEIWSEETHHLRVVMSVSLIGFEL